MIGAREHWGPFRSSVQVNCLISLDVVTIQPVAGQEEDVLGNTEKKVPLMLSNDHCSSLGHSQKLGMQLQLGINLGVVGRSNLFNRDPHGTVLCVRAVHRLPLDTEQSSS